MTALNAEDLSYIHTINTNSLGWAPILPYYFNGELIGGDTDNAIIYLTSWDAGGADGSRLVKIDVSNFNPPPAPATAASVVYLSIDNGSHLYAMASRPPYLYVGQYDQNPGGRGRCAKQVIDRPAFVTVTNTPLGTPHASAGMAVGGRKFVYVIGTQESTSRLAVIKMVDNAYSALSEVYNNPPLRPGGLNALYVNGEVNAEWEFRDTDSGATQAAYQIEIREKEES